MRIVTEGGEIVLPNRRACKRVREGMERRGHPQPHKPDVGLAGKRRLTRRAVSSRIDDQEVKEEIRSVLRHGQISVTPSEDSYCEITE